MPEVEFRFSRKPESEEPLYLDFTAERTRRRPTERAEDASDPNRPLRLDPAAREPKRRRPALGLALAGAAALLLAVAAAALVLPSSGRQRLGAIGGRTAGGAAQTAAGPTPAPSPAPVADAQAQAAASTLQEPASAPTTPGPAAVSATKPVAAHAHARRSGGPEQGDRPERRRRPEQKRRPEPKLASRHRPDLKAKPKHNIRPPRAASVEHKTKPAAAHRRPAGGLDLDALAKSLQ